MHNKSNNSKKDPWLLEKGLFQLMQAKPVLAAVGFLGGFTLTVLVSHLSELTSSSRSSADEANWVSFSNSTSYFDDNENKNDDLLSSVKILCWVMTTPENHKSKAVHVKETWGRRCNKLLFMSSIDDPTLPSVKLDVAEGRDHLWAKTKLSFDYVYRHHLQDADWFFKADDDTYAIIENMRYLLRTFNSSKRLFIGCHLKPYSPQGYMSGGSGYIFSKAALQVLIEKLSNSSCRKDDGGYEDVEIGKCLSGSGVEFVDGRDSEGRLLFLPYVPHSFIIPGRMNQSDTVWFLEYTQKPLNKGFSCCGKYPVSFHYVQPKMMSALEYVIYHVRPQISTN